MHCLPGAAPRSLLLDSLQATSLLLGIEEAARLESDPGRRKKPTRSVLKKKKKLWPMATLTILLPDAGISEVQSEQRLRLLSTYTPRTGLGDPGQQVNNLANIY